VDGAQHPDPVGEGVEVAVSEMAAVLEARDLGHHQPGLGDAHVDQGLDLEAVPPAHGPRIGALLAHFEVHDREALTPEGVVAVTQVGVTGPVDQVHNFVQEVVPELAQPGDVARTGPGHKTRALGEVGPLLEGVDEAGDLGRVGGAVGVEHDDEVTLGHREAAGQGVALAFSGLAHHQDVGAELFGHLDGVVARVAVDQDHLVALGVKGGEDVGEVEGLVLGRDDDADGRLGFARALTLARTFEIVTDHVLSALQSCQRSCDLHTVMTLTSPTGDSSSTTAKFPLHRRHPSIKDVSPVQTSRRPLAVTSYTEDLRAA
jgi:hypothetical protein